MLSKNIRLLRIVPFALVKTSELKYDPPILFSHDSFEHLLAFYSLTDMLITCQSHNLDVHLTHDTQLLVIHQVLSKMYAYLNYIINHRE